MDVELRRKELQSQLRALREEMRQRPCERTDAALGGVFQELRRLDRARDAKLAQELPADAADMTTVNYYPRASCRRASARTRQHKRRVYQRLTP